jgi:hypothetical protein
VHEFPGVAVLAVALVILVGLAGESFGGTPPPLPAAASPAMLNVSAQFGSWTWTGTGSPCDRGSHGTFVAHLFGNATGGTAPYHFVWSFGDGTNVSTGQNTTHLFVTPGGWNVSLVATDELGSTGSGFVHVVPAALSCPSESGGMSNPVFVLLASEVAALLIGALVVGVLVVVVVSRVRRKSKP